MGGWSLSPNTTSTPNHGLPQALIGYTFSPPCDANTCNFKFKARLTLVEPEPSLVNLMFVTGICKDLDVKY